MSILKQKKPAEIQAILDSGVKGDFWQIILAVIEESRQHLQTYSDSDKLKDLPAEQYKLESELIKAKRKYLTMLQETPDNLVSFLSSPDNRAESFDPYATTKEP